MVVVFGFTAIFVNIGEHYIMVFVLGVDDIKSWSIFYINAIFHKGINVCIRRKRKIRLIYNKR